ncbi:hypothetical protein PR001_g31486 [Phytophthora rubi]|uniref:Uncharacterized protein n=1 Tax=Phytophthora rubi TaxID=129364 RepID=A0A6A3GLD6_9STRA|nr:hypothetical protein PR001_g31486 [Phytophthora rubi]
MLTLPVPETQHEPASPAASTTSTLILEYDEDEATATSVQDDSVRATDSGNTNADTAAPSPIPRGRVADPIPRRRSKHAKKPTKLAVESRLQSRKRPRALCMMQSDESFCALPDETKAAIPVMQYKGFTRGYIGEDKKSGSAREQPPDGFFASSASFAGFFEAYTSIATSGSPECFSEARVSGFSSVSLGAGASASCSAGPVSL